MEIDHIKFMTNVMSGQGSSLSFILDGVLADHVFQEELKIDLNMDYLELEFPNWIQNNIAEQDRFEKAFEELHDTPEWKTMIDNWRTKHDKS